MRTHRDRNAHLQKTQAPNSAYERLHDKPSECTICEQSTNEIKLVLTEKLIRALKLPQVRLIEVVMARITSSPSPRSASSTRRYRPGNVSFEHRILEPQLIDLTTVIPDHIKLTLRIDPEGNYPIRRRANLAYFVQCAVFLRKSPDAF